MNNLRAYQLKRPWGIWGNYIFNRLEKFNYPIYEHTIKMLDLKNNYKVLEIGYGTGKLINMILERFNDIYMIGIDFSKLMYKKASKLNRKHIQNNKLKLYNSDFINFEINTEIFDIVYGLNIIYFFNKSIIDKIFRILKKNGMLIFYMNDPTQLNKFGLKSAKAFYKYEIAEIVNKMKETGFSNIQINKCEFKNENGFYLTCEKL